MHAAIPSTQNGGRKRCPKSIILWGLGISILSRIRVLWVYRHGGYINHFTRLILSLYRCIIRTCTTYIMHVTKSSSDCSCNLHSNGWRNDPNETMRYKCDFAKHVRTPVFSKFWFLESLSSINDYNFEHSDYVKSENNVGDANLVSKFITEHSQANDFFEKINFI